MYWGTPSKWRAERRGWCRSVLEMKVRRARQGTEKMSTVFAVNARRADDALHSLRKPRRDRRIVCPGTPPDSVMVSVPPYSDYELATVCFSLGTEAVPPSGWRLLRPSWSPDQDQAAGLSRLPADRLKARFRRLAPIVLPITEYRDHLGPDLSLETAKAALTA